MDTRTLQYCHSSPSLPNSAYAPRRMISPLLPHPPFYLQRTTIIVTHACAVFIWLLPGRPFARHINWLSHLHSRSSARLCITTILILHLLLSRYHVSLPSGSMYTISKSAFLLFRILFRLHNNRINHPHILASFYCVSHSHSSP